MDEDYLYHIGIHDNDNGSFSSFYVISRPGKYQLSILLNDEHHICGSPFSVEVHPSTTDAAMSIAKGETLVQMIPDVISTFTVEARDAYGNRKYRGGDPFELGVMGPAKLHGLVDNQDGTYTCSVEAQNPASQAALTSASISVLVTLHGKHIHGSPFRPSIDMSALKKARQEQQRTKNAAGVGASGVMNRGDMLSRADSAGGSKLEEARQRALEASLEQRHQRGGGDVTPQELVARALVSGKEMNSTSAGRGTSYHGNGASASAGSHVSGHNARDPYLEDGYHGRGVSNTGRMEQQSPPASTLSPKEMGRGPSQVDYDMRRFGSGGGSDGDRRGRGGYDVPPAGPTSSMGGAANSEAKMKQRLSKLDKMTQKLGSSGRLRIEVGILLTTVYFIDS